jgi:hypothetical protein
MDWFEDRRDHWLYVFGRLKPDLTSTAAETAINVPFPRSFATSSFRPSVG